MPTTCWRIKAKTPLVHAIDEMARREGRSVTSLLTRLVSEAIAARRGQAQGEPMPDAFDENERGATFILRKLSHGMCGAIRRLAVAEDRSMASMCKRLLGEALNHRNVSVQRNDPVGADRSADLESAA